MARVSATIPDDDKAWLDAHPEISISGLLQKCISKLKMEYP
jgi:hypothetical protein